MALTRPLKPGQPIPVNLGADLTSIRFRKTLGAHDPLPPTFPDPSLVNKVLWLDGDHHVIDHGLDTMAWYDATLNGHYFGVTAANFDTESGVIPNTVDVKNLSSAEAFVESSGLGTIDIVGPYTMYAVLQVPSVATAVMGILGGHETGPAETPGGIEAVGSVLKAFAYDGSTTVKLDPATSLFAANTPVLVRFRRKADDTVWVTSSAPFVEAQLTTNSPLTGTVTISRPFQAATSGTKLWSAIIYDVDHGATGDATTNAHYLAKYGLATP